MTLADRIDRFLAKPAIGVAIILVVVALQWTLGTDPANICISYLTLGLVLLMGGSNRRERAATQGKLDELVHAVGGARNDLERIEDRDEREIERVRLGDRR